MPTYDYECQACGHAFERWQEMSARKLRTCPECRKKRLVRLVGAGAGVIFKGSGFYETDYKRKSGSGSSGSSSSSASSSSSSSSSDSSSTSSSKSENGGKQAASKASKKSA